jgi:hypothetical protein
MDLLDDMIRADSHGNRNCEDPCSSDFPSSIAHGSVSLAASDSSSRSLCHSMSGALRQQLDGDHHVLRSPRLMLLLRTLPAVPPI